MTSRIYLCRQWTNQIAAFEVSVMSRINDATGPIRWHHKRFLLRHTETFHQLFLGWRNFQVSSLSLLISEIKRPPGWLGSSMTCVTRTAEDMSTRKVSRYCICYTNYEHNFKVQYDRLTVHHCLPIHGLEQLFSTNEGGCIFTSASVNKYELL